MRAIYVCVQMSVYDGSRKSCPFVLIILKLLFRGQANDSLRDRTTLFALVES
nr:MAG TPA: hypothetical protein [Microviridae sp.]